MKVTNHKLNGTQAKIDAGKADATRGLKNDSKSDGVNSHGVGKAGSRVDVSERAQMMQKAKEIASHQAPVDEAKVARFQKLIDEGNYKVDSDKVADRLLDEHMLIPD